MRCSKDFDQANNARGFLTSETRPHTLVGSTTLMIKRGSESSPSISQGSTSAHSFFHIKFSKILGELPTCVSKGRETVLRKFPVGRCLRKIP